MNCTASTKGPLRCRRLLRVREVAAWCVHRLRGFTNFRGVLDRRPIGLFEMLKHVSATAPPAVAALDSTVCVRPTQRRR